MKWVPEQCNKGDVIRSKQGTIYHYGIYVSDEEVIQFGPAPLLHRSQRSDDDMVVLATDISDFACGKTVEKAVLSFREKLRSFSPAKTVERARARIGEGGYNPIHNNCEHFAYECLTGVKYSAQEEELRSKWNSRPMLDVYLSDIPKEVALKEVYPADKAKEIASCKNERVKAEKYWAWHILALAIKTSIRKPIQEVALKKTSNGRWVAEGFDLSITHDDGMVAVAVSNAAVGIDMESLASFREKWSDRKTTDALIQKILARGEARPASIEELLLLWTKKESAFKRAGKGKFAPQKIDTTKQNFAVKQYNDHLITLCSDRTVALNFYLTDGEKTEKLKD